MSSQTTQEVLVSETPFDKRHCCWFCGEPNSKSFVFPPRDEPFNYSEKSYIVLSCPHPRLSVPSCNECYLFATKCDVRSIWLVKEQVKRALLKRYRKDLAIGVNWTKQALQDSEFEQGNFAGFQRSAWFMYEVAKDRVNYPSWDLTIEGVTLLANTPVNTFTFDDVAFPTIDDAIEHYAKTFHLNSHYFSAVYQHMAKGYRADATVEQRVFSKAVRFCRLLVGATPDELKQAFKALK